jgi:shikimate dehydrogenase
VRRFGLIGFPLSHSFSRKYFTEKFVAAGMTDCFYENFPLEEITELPELLDSYPDIVGLNVTIPYKEKVLPYLAVVNDIVKGTGACNCIRVHKDNLVGFNTDVAGFSISLQHNLRSTHDRALVLGKGGAAKAVAYALRQLDIPFKYVVRKADDDPNTILYESLTADDVAAHPLIINTTPLGMYPDVLSYPPIPYEGIRIGHYLFDLVYNPIRTVFLRKGEDKGAIVQNGGEMLSIQAEESWKIWNQY